MKKHPIFIAVLSAFIVLSAFVGCSDQVVFPLSVVSAEIIQEKDMLVGQDFDASNFIVRVTYNNGSPKDLRGIVDFDGTTVTNGAEISANAGRDMYGEDYYVYGYINAYELTGLEVTGPATINTDSQNSVTVKAEDLTVNAKYAVKGETRTMTLVPVADFTVSSVSIDDGVTLDTSKTDAAATATVLFLAVNVVHFLLYQRVQVWPMDTDTRSSYSRTIPMYEDLQEYPYNLE